MLLCAAAWMVVLAAPSWPGIDVKRRAFGEDLAPGAICRLTVATIDGRSVTVPMIAFDLTDEARFTPTKRGPVFTAIFDDVPDNESLFVPGSVFRGFVDEVHVGADGDLNRPNARGKNGRTVVLASRHVVQGEQKELSVDLEVPISFWPFARTSRAGGARIFDILDALHCGWMRSGWIYVDDPNLLSVAHQMVAADAKRHHYSVEFYPWSKTVRP